MAQVDTLRRYPVKGMTGETLDHITLDTGQGVPGDRAMGLVRSDVAFDATNPQPMPKESFVVLAFEAALAGLHSVYDPGRRILTISGRGVTDSFAMDDRDEAARAAQWIARAIGLPDTETPTLQRAEPLRFTGVAPMSPKMMNAVSLLNRNSVDAFAAEIGTAVDTERFRANVILSGLPAFSELAAIGQRIQIGPVVMELVHRTKRCAATEVNPTTAERDLRVPYLLRKAYGHMDMGVYGTVLTGGTIRPGDPVTYLPAA